MGTHSSYFADADNAVVVPREKPKHPALALEASRAWNAHTRALELQRLAVTLAAAHSVAVKHDKVTSRMRRSVVLLSVLALVCVLALAVAVSDYGQQLST